MKNKKWTKVALTLSICLFVAWWALGISATLAWFTGTDTVRNQFQIGLIDLEVSYRNDAGTEYTPLEGSTETFNDEALYEPGYTQVVWLKLDNRGNVDFNYKLAVTVSHVTNGKNAWGEEIYLPNYLRYGAVFGETEAEVQQLVADRLAAKNQATKDWGMLGEWSDISPYTFEVGENSHYAALIVYMPEEVDNVANYRGFDQPRLELGITVYAQQANAPLE